MKTNGQKLYEYENPTFISVVLEKERAFGKPFLVQNPKFIVPWELLTQDCRDSYHTDAKAHFLFQKKKA